MAKITLDFSRISDKQRRFMEALTRYVAYGGARGGRGGIRRRLS